jgi:hypothetical protein
MKVLGVGLSKTGTSSLHSALQILGFRAVHYDLERFRDIFDGSNPNPKFRRFDDIDAITDEPAAYFYEEVMPCYPSCKFVLTVRDEHSWWTSIRDDFSWGDVLGANSDLNVKRKLYMYGSSEPREFLYKKRYREHVERVTRKLPHKRLLKMNIISGDGWEKLCPFLGVNYPDVPFPHLNKRSENERWFRLWPLSGVAAEEIAELVAPGGDFMLVDDYWIARDLFSTREAIRFFERDGQYWGPPADDETAIRELERRRVAGASHIVFAWPAFWWLEYYPGFHRYLRTKFHCVLENERLVAFQLTGRQTE